MTSWVDDLTFTPDNTRSNRMRPKKESSPYYGRPDSEWADITRGLLRQQPLTGPTLTAAVLKSWSDIFESQIGVAKIGVDVEPSPQVMGFLLHELIPLTISKTLPEWRRDSGSREKDLVYVPDSLFSIEIKTSSHASGIFGNRSFGQDTDDVAKKAKSGYYCAVNFQAWSVSSTPKIKSIRYGWLDSTDWVAQASASGQQSSLPGLVYARQLPLVFSDVSAR